MTKPFSTAAITKSFFFLSIFFIVAVTNSIAQPTVTNKTLAKGQGILFLSDLGESCVSGTCSGCTFWEKDIWGYSCQNSSSCDQVDDLTSTSSVDYGSIRFNNTQAGTFTYQVMELTEAVEPDINCDVQNQGPFQTTTFTITVLDWKWDTPISDHCENDDVTYNLDDYISHSSGVTYSGSGVSGDTWNPLNAGPGTHSIVASKSFDNGTQTVTMIVTVHPLPSVNFSNPPAFCKNDTDDPDLSSFVNVTGGLFTHTHGGDLVLYGTGNKKINLALSTPGLYSVTYSYTDGNGCSNYASASIDIDPEIQVDAGPNQESCENNGEVALNAATSGVTWECVDCSYVTDGKFDTDAAPAGTYTVRASKSEGACSDTDDKTFTVNGLPSVEAGNDITACIDNGSFNLSGESPTGGIWSASCSTCLSGSLFDPVGAGPGNHTITYTYANAQGCLSSDSRTVTVVALPDANDISITEDQRCGDGTVSLNASLSGHTIKWYSTSLGGTALETSNSFNPSITVGTTTYYVEAVNGDGCISESRKAVDATAFPVPSDPVAADVSRCGAGTVDLTASGGIAGAIYDWWANESGGISLHTASTFTTPSLSTTKTYYVSATSPDGCVSPGRTAVDAIINSIPGTPTTFDDTHCGTGEVTLSVGGAPSGGEYAWYTAASGGSPFNNSNEYIVMLSMTTSYWVSIITGEGCEGDRAEVTGTIFSIPTVPNGIGYSRCGPGTVDLSVSGTNAAEFNWYGTEVSTVSLHTGETYSPSVSGSRSYWVEMTDNNGCISSRDEVQVTVHAVPNDPIAVDAGRCGPGTIQLSASGSGTGADYDWYENPSGGSSLFTGSNFTTPSLTTTKSYYVEATSSEGCLSANRTEVVAIINSVPGTPITFDNFSCGAGIVTLNVAGAPVDGEYRWYTSESGGSSFNDSDTYDANLAVTESYWVSIVSGEGCEGPREEITANIYDVPDGPGGFDGERCAEGTVTLTASASISGDINWYQTEFSLVSIFTGAEFITPHLIETTSYWVDITDGNSCVSERTEITAVINDIPPDPIASDIESCGPGQVTLDASGSGVDAVYDWYENASGGSPVHTGDYFQPSVTSSRSYYLEAKTPQGCVSNNRMEVSITINPLPSEPLTFDGGHCGPGTINLTVAGAPAGGEYRWYDQQSGGISFNNDNSFDSDVTSTTSYWVSVITPEGCEGPREEILAVVNEIPGQPNGTDGERCGEGTVSLSASNVTTGSFNWYETPVSAVSLFTGVNFVTPTISSSTSYYVEITDLNNCVSERTEVIAVVSDIPPDPVVSDINRCGPGQVELMASEGAEGAQYRWYENGSGGNPVFTGDTFTTTVDLTRNYFVDGLSQEGCVSENRTEVTVTINHFPDKPIVNDASNCGPGVVPLTVAGTPSGGTYGWYVQETGGIPFNNSNSWEADIEETTSYWVSIQTPEGCEGTREKITASVLDIPTAPNGNDSERCGTGSVTISATSGEPGTFDWYETASSAVSIFTGVNLTTPPISETIGYWVEFKDIESCISDRTEVTAAVLDVISDPVVPEIDHCGPGEVSINAFSTTEGAIFEWYENQFGGTPVHIGDTYEVDLILSDSYYVGATNPEGCKSENRTPVTVTINPVPSAPLVEDGSVCDEGEVVMTATGSPHGGSYRWYETTADINAIGTGSEFTSPIVSVSRSYYVSIVNEYGCEGDREEVRAIVNGSPGTPVVEDVLRCGKGDIEIDAVPDLPDATINWYENPDGIIPFATGKKLSLDDLDETTHYFATTITGEGCESEKSEVRAIIEPIVPADIGENIQVCVNVGAYDLSEDLSGVTVSEGFFLGPGVIGNDFYPEIVGLGNHEITFLLNTEIGCLDNGSRFLTVIDVKENGEELELSKYELNHCITAGLLDLRVLANIPGGSWNIDAPEGSMNVGVVDPEIAGVGEFTAIYNVEVNGCSVTATIGVNITAAPSDPIISGPAQICKGDTTSLEIDSPESDLVYYWYRENMEIPFDTGISVVLSPEATQVFRVTSENAFGCFSQEIEHTLNVIDIGLDFNASPTIIKVGDRVEFSTSVAASEYLWDFGDDLSSTEQNPSHIFFETGIYDVTLEVFTEDGCHLTRLKEALITVEDDSTNGGELITGINDESGVTHFLVYPLPFRDQFTLRIESPVVQNANITLYTLTGNAIIDRELQLTPGENEIVLGPSDLSMAGGVYLLILRDQNYRTYQHRIIKQN